MFRRQSKAKGDERRDYTRLHMQRRITENETHTTALRNLNKSACDTHTDQEAAYYIFTTAKWVRLPK